MKNPMKYLILLSLAIVFMGCSQKDAEKFAFRKVLEYELVDKCGDDEECIVAVKTQIPGCMEESDWYRYLNSDEDAEEFNRFANAFYACIVDPNGNPYFELQT